MRKKCNPYFMPVSGFLNVSTSFMREKQGMSGPKMAPNLTVILHVRGLTENQFYGAGAVKLPLSISN
jgi:hypothetical protein